MKNLTDFRKTVETGVDPGLTCYQVRGCNKRSGGGCLPATRKVVVAIFYLRPSQRVGSY